MINVIVNPASGHGLGAVLAEEVLRALKERGAAATASMTHARGDAEMLARRASAEREAGAVVCIGGDGTVAEVANGLAGTGTPFALVPTGTANMLGSEFGIRRDARAAAEAVLGGNRVILDAGRWGERLFLCVAGVGVDAEIARRYGRARKRLGGYPAYVLPTLAALVGAGRPRLCLEVDGKALQGAFSWAMAGNLNRYGWPLKFTKSADPTDGLLDLAATRRGGFFDDARCFVLAASGRFPGAPGTVLERGRRLVVRPESGEAQVQLDGDHAGNCSPLCPAVFEAVPRAVALLLPPGLGFRAPVS